MQIQTAQSLWQSNSTPADVFTVSPTLDTSAYVDGDLMFVANEIPDAFMTPGGVLWITSVIVHDDSDQGGAFDLVFLDATEVFGTLGSNNLSISDANTLAIKGRVQVVANDYYDFGGARVAFPVFTPRLIKAAAGATSLYVAGISRDTKTYAATALHLDIGVSY